MSHHLRVCEESARVSPQERAASPFRQLTVLVATAVLGIAVQSSIPFAVVLPGVGLVAVALAKLVRVWEIVILIPVVLGLAAGGLFGVAAYFTIPVACVLALGKGCGSQSLYAPLNWQRLGPVFVALTAAVLSVATALTSSNTNLALLGQLAVWAGVVLALLAIRLRSRSWEELQTYGSAALAGLALVYLVQVVPATAVLMDNSWALRSSVEYGWINPNALGMVFAAAGVSRLKTALVRGPRALDSLIALVLLLGCGFTFSRSSYLALIVALPFVFLSRSRWVLLAIPVAVIAVQNLPASIEQRIRYTGSAGHLDASSIARLELWQAALTIAADYSIFGVGVHSLGAALAGQGAGSGFIFAHNTYLTLLASFGIILPVVCMSLLALMLCKPMERTSGGREPGHSIRHTPVLVVLAVASFFGEPLLLPSVVVVSLLLVTSPYYSERRKGTHGIS